jgi:hypothetical protein
MNSNLSGSFTTLHMLHIKTGNVVDIYGKISLHSLSFWNFFIFVLFKKFIYPNRPQMFDFSTLQREWSINFDSYFMISKLS